MKSVQMNTRVPKDIKEFLDGLAAEDNRDRGYILNKLIRPMMEAEAPQPANQQSMINNGVMV